MNVLIGGLCLSRNLGGPAMGLTMVDEIRRRIPDARFKFAVHTQCFDLEKEWGERYGLEVVPRMGMQEYYRLRHARILRLVGRAPKMREERMAVMRELMAAFEWADVVINNEGISYVGDGVRRWTQSLTEHSSYQFSRIKRRPYNRFIQSYGPIADWRVRWLAKRELSHLPFVFARGRSAAESCSAVVNSDLVRCVPDCAILLSKAGKAAGEEMLAELGLRKNGYLVLSPSAVIVNTVKRDTPGCIGEKHVDAMEFLARRLLEKGKELLFLPHMYSPVERDCDRAVCRKVLERLEEHSAVRVVERDADAREAKWLIANAQGCVVSRYHALVAAISTATPVVAIGWNDKYRDLLDFYGAQSMAVDARDYEPAELCEVVLSRLGEFDDEMIEKVRGRHEDNARMVYEAFDELTDWMTRVTS